VRQARNVSRFLVASNVAFDIFVESTDLVRTGDFTDLDFENIGFRALINRTGGSGEGRWGENAQNPAIGGEGIDDTLNDLGDFSSGPVKLFDGGRRTAVRYDRCASELYGLRALVLSQFSIFIPNRSA